MIQNIPYNGQTTVPSDYSCPDGDLAYCINAEFRDGAIHPAIAPKVLFTIPDNYELHYIHSTGSSDHYIVSDLTRTRFHIFDPDKNTLSPAFCELPQTAMLYSINAIGNTLLILSSRGIYYCLLKDGAYRLLGNRMPDLPLRFSLSGELVSIEKDKTAFPEDLDTNRSTLTQENSRYATETFLAYVNSFVAEQAHDKGLFMFPFFVRYAFRLYDGTLTRHSAPVLIRPVVGQNPVVHLTGDSKKEFRVFVEGIVASLQMQIPLSHNKAIGELKNWSDIIQSIDIFISAPLYTYDQSGTIDSIYRTPAGKSSAYTTVAIDSAPAQDRWHKLSSVIHRSGIEIALPQFDTKQLETKARDCSLFYFLTSIKPDQLLGTNMNVNVPHKAISTIVTHETMTDDFDSSDTIVPRISFTYNQRLNLAGITKQTHPGIDTSAFIQEVDATQQYPVTPYIFIRREGESHIIKGKEFSLGQNSQIPYVYHPCSAVYRIVFARRPAPGAPFDRYLELTMKPHPMLNGAVWGHTPLFATDTPWLDAANYTFPDDSKVTQYAPTEYPSKIYTSDVNNPFSFPITGINTISAGRIIAISAATKALSQGQFGQFPLYAFTSDGVWAMEVGSDGTFTTKQPVTRDICTNADAITQIDNAVLFPTKRGIIMLSGAQTFCITDTINDDTPFDAMQLQATQELSATLGFTPPTLKPFSRFLPASRMIFDYIHQRIILWARGATYAYTYSLRTSTWSMILTDLAKNIAAYPEALAVDNRNQLLDYSAGTEPEGNIYILSRPLKLGDPDTLKTVSIIIQRGNFRRGHLATVLYGSRDLFDWSLIWSSVTHRLRSISGSPYRYFRIAVVGQLTPGESIRGASLQFTPRMTNRLR